MPSPPLDSTHGRTTSGVACHRRLKAAHTVERRQAWHAIIAFGLADTVGQRRAWHAIIALNSKHGRTTSGVAYHHRLWAAQTVGQHWALHAIITFGQHTQSKDVGRGMPSSPLGSTDDRMTSGVTCNYRLWAAHTVERHQAWHAIIALG